MVCFAHCASVHQTAATQPGRQIPPDQSPRRKPLRRLIDGYRSGKHLDAAPALARCSLFVGAC